MSRPATTRSRPVDRIPGPGEDFDPGTLEGAYGTQPGSFAADDFKERLAETIT